MVDEHIGRLYTAFLNVNSTLDWVRFLSEVEELSPPPAKLSAAEQRRLGVEGGVLFQKFKMPWPVRDREVVLQRTVLVDKQAKKMTATCELCRGVRVYGLNTGLSWGRVGGGGGVR